MNPTRAVSILIPCYNEAESLPHLLRKLDATVATLGERGVTTEVILVDDGSHDDSRRLLREATRERPYLRTIHLARNFGQTAAMAAGFDAARFDVVVPLDADLQNDPADVAALLDKLDQGFDVVSGWRRQRKDMLVTRKIPSWIANALISVVSGVRLHDYGCTLKAYRRFVLQGVHLYGEMHRFIPIYAAQRGARVAEIEVTHHARQYGRTKYGLGRIPNVLLDLALAQMLWKYGTKPMHLFGKFGLLSMGLSLLFFLTMVWYKFWGGKDFVATPLPHLTVLSFLVGCLSVLLGLLAEMTMRTYYESSQTATYVVRETCSGGEATDLSQTPPQVTS
ncbi:MAG: glycosyltransferase family 2 protein [Deltaproteobacteria bacterium]|nr:glycosyltransferase family 2 protein [Deltaproteobacteria bacterium]